MIELRRATPQDAPAILGLMERLGDFPVPPWRSAAEIAAADRSIVLDGLQQPTSGQAIFVAAREDRVLGFLFVVARTDYFTHEQYAYVEDLALAVEGEGQGLARRLMDAAEAWAVDRGFRRIGLSVWSQNVRARGLYERLGYQPETIHLLKQL